MSVNLSKGQHQHMATASDRHFYLCPPTYFEIEYVINDWMDIDSSVDKNLAKVQWQSLVDVYEELGVKLTILDPIQDLPDLVFPGDSIFLFGEHAIASNFRHAERAPEVPAQVNFFKDLGYKITNLPKEFHYEGNAETILWNGRLFGGYGLRTDKEIYPYLSEVLDIEIIPLKVHAPYFHLDVALCPIDNETVAYTPDALGKDSQAMVEALATKTIKVSKEEATMLGVNSMVIDDTVILSTTKAPNFCIALKEHGLNVITLELTEFYKSGGGVKCLTLEAYNFANQ